MTFTPSGSYIQNNELSCFLLTIDSLKMVIDLVFLIPTLCLFHSFIQYGKKCSFKGFCSCWNWSYNTDPTMILIIIFLRREIQITIVVA